MGLGDRYPGDYVCQPFTFIQEWKCSSGSVRSTWVNWMIPSPSGLNPNWAITPSCISVHKGKTTCWYLQRKHSVKASIYSEVMMISASLTRCLPTRVTGSSSFSCALRCRRFGSPLRVPTGKTFFHSHSSKLQPFYCHRRICNFDWLKEMRWISHFFNCICQIAMFCICELLILQLYRLLSLQLLVIINWISQYKLKFAISTEIHNFNWISQFWLEFHNFNQIS